MIDDKSFYIYLFTYSFVSVNEELAILICRVSVNNFIKMIYVGLNMAAILHLRYLYNCFNL